MSSFSELGGSIKYVIQRVLCFGKGTQKEITTVRENKNFKRVLFMELLYEASLSFCLISLVFFCKHRVLSLPQENYRKASFLVSR